MKSMSRVLLAAGLASLLSSCQHQESWEPEQLARYDGGTIELAELDAMLVRPGARGEAGAPRDGQWFAMQIERLFQRKVLLASPERGALEKDVAVAEEWEQLSAPILASAYLQEHPAPELTDAQIESYFEAHKDTFRLPERRAISNLFLRLPDDQAGGVAACSELAELRQRIVAGESFEALAREHSQTANASVGGLIGLVSRGQLAPELEAAAFALESGQMTPVLRDRSGCHLLRVAQIQPLIEPDFTALKFQLLSQLSQQVQAAHFQKLANIIADELGLAAPDATLLDADANAVLFEIDGKAVTRNLVRARAAALKIPPQSALIQLFSERLFAHAQLQVAPEASATLLADQREDFLLERLRVAALKQEAGEIDEATLRSYYEQHKPRYSSDPNLELELLTWPLRGCEGCAEPAPDPYRSQARAVAFAEQLQVEHEGSDEAVWTDFAKEAGAVRTRLPLADILALTQRYPALAVPLVSDLAEGTVLGPFRFDDRVAVAKVQLLIPSRQLGFLEVRNRVLSDFLNSGASGFEQRWAERIRQERHLQIRREVLDRIGEMLLTRLDAAAGS